MKTIAHATFDSYFESGITAQQSVYVLSKLPIAGSLSGNKESTRYLIPSQIQSKEIEVMPNHMDLREGEQTTSIQRLGRAAEALAYALCQSIPASPGKEAIIRVFPAWPDEWDAQFSLLCRGGFLVNSSFQNGKPEFVSITSQQGKPCHLRNPWTGKDVIIYRNGKRWKKTNESLITFQTKINDYYLITPDGVSKNQINIKLSVAAK
jgi:hypothetical protein